MILWLLLLILQHCLAVCKDKYLNLSELLQLGVQMITTIT